MVALVPTAELLQWPAFRALGPEPLGADLSPAHLKRAFTSRRAAVKLLLMDQRIVAGLGNIYACEALFRARIDPRKPGGQVSTQALGRLASEIRAVIGDAVDAGGSTLRNYAQPDGELGHFVTRLDVYGREGLGCTRCDGGKVRRIVQGGRSTWYCGKCQK
jgi:formamidopyrimidine-DNA glycosylase